MHPEIALQERCSLSTPPMRVRLHDNDPRLKIFFKRELTHDIDTDHREKCRTPVKKDCICLTGCFLTRTHEGFRISARNKGRPQISPLRYAPVPRHARAGEMTILFEHRTLRLQERFVETQIPPRHAGTGRLPRFPFQSCDFGQLHVVLFKENHISGAGESHEAGNPGTLDDKGKGNGSIDSGW